MSKFFLSLLFLLASLALQFFLTSFGRSFDFAFAVMIALAFVLEFIEFLPLVLFGVLMLNWQPVASVPLLVYLLFPLAVYEIYKLFPWEPLVAVPVGIALGIALLLIVSGAGISAIGIGAILGNIVVSAAFGLGVYAIIRA